MSQPAAPAATIVTTLSSSLGRSASAGSGQSVPSHPLGDLEDKPAKDSEAYAPEKNDRDHCLPFLICTESIRRYPRLQQVTNC
jgi:hypothetical protein